ncbi:MAG: ferrous iron transport protein B [Flavobacteriia bacterium]|nr:ferrous iron transport protein B [Flavobacteriia bacterium]
MKIALLGNPNTGKSSVFNLLTGMRQHVGNFPGVTVDKKVGDFKTSKGEILQIIDFPGTYSLYPRSKDENVVYDVLSNQSNKDFPDLAIVVADAANLERNLFIFTQIHDLKIPSILVLNMSDVANRKGKKINIEALQKHFPDTKIVETNARVGLGIDRLKETIENYNLNCFESNVTIDFKLLPIDDLENQSKEAEIRYETIAEIVNEATSRKELDTNFSKSSKLDKILVHPILGYLFFGLVLMILFQLIYVFAAVPMDLIDGSFSTFSSWLQKSLPEGLFFDLISQGIVPGIGGVIVFIPQIALLFFFISLLEESGYLARVVFIMDRLMRPLGLNGKSVVPLLSSVACAIPGIMATRTISSWKERLITIFVAPLMSCSARIPVYTLLIALVIPAKTVFGFVNLQGLVLFGLYALGLISALAIATILKFFIATKEKSFLLLELPSYKSPRWGNVGITVFEKVKVFIFDAGKVILAVSILLWGLATFGPADAMKNGVKQVENSIQFKNSSPQAQDQMIASAKLQNSFIGHFGQAIEPIIAPIGYDWKIGVSLITSFAAREVFVGSLSTIYSVHDNGDSNVPLIQHLRSEKRMDGTKVYTVASGVSLMVFYVYAMQCMATMAVVKRETKSWKWPIIQMVVMGILAYVGAFIAYTSLS